MMQEFMWRGIDSTGRRIRGTAKAAGGSELASLLLAQGVALLVFKRASVGTRRSKFFVVRGRISSKHLALFFYHVGVLVQQGVPLNKALATFAQYAPTRQLTQRVSVVQQKLEQGVPFVDSCRDADLVSDLCTLALLDVGHRTETLGLVLCELSEFLVARTTLAQELRQALYVPALTLMCAGLVVIFVVGWVVPSCGAVLQSSGQQLPPATRMLLACTSGSGLMVVGGVLASLVLCGFALVHLSQATAFGRLVARVQVHIPIIGPLVQATQRAWWAAAFSLGLRVGMPLVQAFQGANSMVTNAWLHDAFVSALHEVQQGVDVAAALGQHGCFSGHLLALLAAGQHADQLPIALKKVEQELTRTCAGIRALIGASVQPLVILVLGAVIGFVLVAVYVPLFSMARVLGP